MKSNNEPNNFLSNIKSKFSLAMVRKDVFDPRKQSFDVDEFEASMGDIPLLRPDVEGFALMAADSVPSRRIATQIGHGRAFFDRHQFSPETNQTSVEKVAAAVQSLAYWKPDIKIDMDAPDVSIIVPIYGQMHFVLNCLDSLAAHNSRFSVEIIVVDDASPSNAQTETLRAIPWIRYIRRSKNGGFIDSCNEAAEAAKGAYLVFLNSDVRVADHWLDELIGSFSVFPKAGLIGSKLYSEDGVLQDAGGLVWREEGASNYGRGDDGNHPKYCFARQADYCTGAAIAVPKDAWQKTQGFDTAFRPAYCEDADLAFRLRRDGYEVWLQPLSCVLHYEGKTHGRDLTSGIKAYQVINMKQFFTRWKSALITHQFGEDPDAEANRPVTKRILVLDAESPMPDRDCGSVFVIRMLGALRDLGYQITFVPHANYCFYGHYTEDLQRLGIECLYAPYFKSIDEVLDYRSDFDAVLAYRYYILGPVYETIRKRMPLARILFSNVDLHYLREQREADIVDSPRARSAAMITKATELEILCRADCAIVHTENESQIIKQHVQIENIVELPYTTEPLLSAVDYDERFDVMFLGGFRHIPNVDAVLHFHETVWPKLLEKLPPRARLLIVGASPPPEIKNLASDRVVVTGFVEDLAPWFDAARVFVAPLRFGAGIKGKVIESLRHGAPCVVSQIAAEGIGMTSGQDAIIVDDDEGFTNAVLRLYGTPALWLAMQTGGYELVRQRFSPDQFLDLCAKILKTADTVWMTRKENSIRRRLKMISDYQD